MGNDGDRSLHLWSQFGGNGDGWSDDTRVLAPKKCEIKFYDNSKMSSEGKENSTKMSSEGKGKSTKMSSEGMGKSIPSKKILFRCSPTRLHHLVRDLNPIQRKIVVDHGFGGLLTCLGTSLPYKVMSFLIEHTSHENAKIMIGSGIDLAKLVHPILGIPHGDVPVPMSGEEDISLLSARYNIGGQVKPVKHVIAEMKTDVNAETFIQSFILVVLNVFLCPNSSLSVNAEYLYAIRDVSKISSMDWTSHVLQYLLSSVSKYKEKMKSTRRTLSVHGCVYLLLVALADFQERTVGPTLTLPPPGYPRIGCVKAAHFAHFARIESAELEQQFLRGTFKVLSLDKTVYSIPIDQQPHIEPVQGIDIPVNIPNNDGAIGDQLPPCISKIDDVVKSIIQKYTEDIRSQQQRLFDEWKQKLFEEIMVIANRSFDVLTERLGRCEAATLSEMSKEICATMNSAKVHEPSSNNKKELLYNGHIFNQGDSSAAACDNLEVNTASCDVVRGELTKEKVSCVGDEEKVVVNASSIGKDPVGDTKAVDDLISDERGERCVDSIGILDFVIPPISPAAVDMREVLSTQHVLDHGTSPSRGAGDNTTSTTAQSEPDHIIRDNPVMTSSIIEVEEFDLPKLDEVSHVIPTEVSDVNASGSSVSKIVANGSGTPKTRKRRLVAVVDKSVEDFVQKKAHKMTQASNAERLTYEQYVSVNLSEQAKKHTIVHINGGYASWEDFSVSFKPRGHVSNNVMLLVSRALLSDWDTPARIILTPKAAGDLTADPASAQLGTAMREINLAFEELTGTRKKLQLVYLPILHGEHWFLYVFNFTLHHVDVMDSLYRAQDQFHDDIIKNVAINMSNVMKTTKGKRYKEDIVQWPNFWITNAQQSNIHDSGIFVVMFLRWFNTQQIAECDQLTGELVGYRMKVAHYLIHHPENLACPCPPF